MCHAGAASTARESASGRWSPVEFGSMDIVLANPRGFCAGVDRAIEIVKRAIETLGAPIYVRHEVVHNRYVVDDRSEEHTSELQSLMRISYAVFCLKKNRHQKVKKQKQHKAIKPQ